MAVTDVVRDPRTFLSETIGLYRTLLFDPRTFYANAGTRGLSYEAVLVAVVGLVGTVGSLYATQAITTGFEDALTQDVEMRLWGEGLEPLFGAFVLWIGFTAVVYALSWLYSTAGNFYLLLKYSAWSLVPLVIGNAITTAGFLATTVSTELDTESAIPTLPEARLQHMWEQIAHEPMALGAYLVGSLFVLWCGYIAAYGVADVRELERDEAYRVVAVPVVAYLLYVVYGVAGAVL